MVASLYWMVKPFVAMTLNCLFIWFAIKKLLAHSIFVSSSGGKGLGVAEICNILTDSCCKFPTKETMGAQNFNSPLNPPKRGFLT